ncbi:ead/Ea22-like family protein [Pseudomonas aeruginosa]
MTDHAELRRLAEAATPGPWSCNRHWAIVGGPTLEFTNGAAQQQIAMACWQSWMREEELRNNAAFMAAANPKTILALLDEIDGMKASGWRNHSVNYARAEKCPQTLETAQAAWDRDQELIEEQRQQIARDSQTINQLRQKLQSAEVDRDRLKAENEVLRRFAGEAYQVLGALDAPENVLDNASDAANGLPLRHETLLPFFADDYESMRKDAERYRFYRQGFVSPSELDTNIDSALEGATQ